MVISVVCGYVYIGRRKSEAGGVDNRRVGDESGFRDERQGYKQVSFP